MRRLLDVVGMTAVYFVAAHAGLFLAVPGTNVSPMWPATGMALAAMVWRGRHMVFGIIAGELLANTQVFFAGGTPLGTSLLISGLFGIGNSMEALIGYWLYQRWVGAPVATRTLATTWGFLRTAATMCLTSAVVGIGTLSVLGLQPWGGAGSALFTWWLGNVAGVVLVTPLLLEILRPQEIRIAPMGQREAMALLATSVLLPALIFTGALHAVGLANPLLLVAVVLWAAFRSTPVMVSGVMAVVATVSLTAVAAGVLPTLLAQGDLFALGISTAGGGSLVLLAQAALNDRLHAHQSERQRADQLAVAVQSETQAARDAALRRDAIFTHALEGIITVDDGMHIVETNRAAQKLLQSDAYDLVGISFDDLLPGCATAVRTHQRRFEGTLNAGIPVELSWTTWSMAGATFHTAFIRDMTERVEVERQRRDAREAEQALAAMAEQAAFRTEFLNHAAHEIRTPMTPLLLQVSILRHMEQHMPDNATHAVHAIQRNLSRLKRILDDMLDVGRFQAGRLEVNQEELDIIPILNHVIQDHKPVMAEKEIRLHVRAPQSANIHGDPDRVNQILGNLLSNAAKYTPDGGRVDVEVANRLGAVEVRVKDTGLGMDQGQLDRLFQAFSRVHPDLPIPGTGLGLYVSQSLARLHQGDLLASSDGPGQGSCFTLRLPAPETMRETVQYSDSSPGLATTSGRGIL